MAYRNRPLDPVRSSWRDLLRNYLHRSATPLRRRYYTHPGWGERMVGRLSERWRRRLGLDDPASVGSRRLEIGSGGRPQPGYVHVDVDPRAWHVEAVAPAWRLPFSDGWAEEIVAVHILEHIHPQKLLPTLQEWRRVLAPGGRVRVHVPNTVEILESFIAGPIDRKWALMSAVLGMNGVPGTRRPEEIRWLSDHQILFDRGVLAWAFEAAGFQEVVDRTGGMSDFHTEAWRPLVPHFSLIFEATKDGVR